LSGQLFRSPPERVWCYILQVCSAERPDRQDVCCRHAGKSGDQLLPRYNKDQGCWTAPFIMSSVNTRIVRISAALQKSAYGKLRLHQALVLSALDSRVLPKSTQYAICHITYLCGVHLGCVTSCLVPLVPRSFLEEMIIAVLIYTADRQHIWCAVCFTVQTLFDIRLCEYCRRGFHLQ